MTRSRQKPRAAAPRAAAGRAGAAPTLVARLAAWADAHRQPVVRLTTVLGAAATVVLTWPLWAPRAAPPNLPLLPLPGVLLGPILLAALALALWRPAVGLAGYVAALAYGVLGDQARLQPQLLTFAFLLAATLPGRAGLTLARWHLVVLWFYAGLHKLLSVDFMAQTDTYMMRELVGLPSPLARAVFPWLVVATEMGAALLAALPRTRPLAALAAVLLHLGILLMLGRAGYNASVWPWNVVCAVAAVMLILPWRRSLREEWRAASRPLRAALVAMAVYPLGFYAGLTDAYTSWSLYAANAPRGLVCDLSTALPPPRPGLVDEYTYNHRDGTFRCRRIELVEAVGAPLPPIHRLFRDYFRRTCADGEFLLIHERRRGFRDPESAEQAYFCADERASRTGMFSPAGGAPG